MNGFDVLASADSIKERARKITLKQQSRNTFEEMMAAAELPMIKESRAPWDSTDYFIAADYLDENDMPKVAHLYRAIGQNLSRKGL